MDKLAVVILAAGQGKRMQSHLPKVLHCLYGRPLLDHVIDTGNSVSPGKIVVVIGHKGNMVKDTFKDAGVEFAVQAEQLGTGHAVAQTESEIDTSYEDILVLSGDVPMIKSCTISNLLQIHRAGNMVISFLSTRLSDPHGYGRVLRDKRGDVIGIVEENDADNDVKLINEINSGVYCFKRNFLFNALSCLNRDNEQKEYYLTDVVRYAVKKGLPIKAVTVSDWREIMGINTCEDLLRMEQLIVKEPGNK